MKTVVFTLAALSLFACTRSKPVDQRSTVITETTPSKATTMDDQDKAGTTTLTSAAWIGNDTAMDRIAISRCARESTCASTGAGGGSAHAVDQTACVGEMRTRMWSALRADMCPSGIKGDPLDECIQAIQHESCNNPLESLSRLTQCRTSALCGK